MILICANVSGERAHRSMWGTDLSSDISKKPLSVLARAQSHTSSFRMAEYECSDRFRFLMDSRSHFRRFLALLHASQAEAHGGQLPSSDGGHGKAHQRKHKGDSRRSCDLPIICAAVFLIVKRRRNATSLPPQPPPPPQDALQHGLGGVAHRMHDLENKCAGDLSASLNVVEGLLRSST